MQPRSIRVKHVRLLFAAGVLAAVVVTAFPGVAWPAFPGVNGAIAFTTDRDGNYEIYALAPDGTETNLSDDAADDASPAWSPNGKMISFTRCFELYTMDAEGGNQRKVADIPGGPSEPAWSPDGSQIAFESYTADGGFDIYVINVDGTGLTNLTNTPSSETAPANEYRVDWSPGGDQILFTSDRDGSIPGETLHTYVFDVLARTQTKLIDDPYAVWSPDGTKIAFARARDGGPYSDIYVASIQDLDHPIKLTDDPSVNYNPAWSPDGSQIVFSSQRDGDYELYVVPADHLDNARRLTTDAGADFAPDWQPVQSPKATVLVAMQVVNDNGGTLTANDFSMTVLATNPSPTSFPGQGPPGTTVTLDPGSYSVSVTGPSGYTTTLSADCASTIADGETKTCTITADDPPPAVPMCNGRVATIVGTTGPTDIRGTSGNDVIVDLDGNNIIRGRGGSDTICTGPGKDQIDASGGSDTIIDTGGDNTVQGGGGNDAITTGSGNDTIDAGAGNDTVNAGGGDNTVYGQGGNDTITSTTGNDRIDGGLGFDRCSPGGGVNTVTRCEVVT